MDKTKRMKTWGLILFYLALYTPIFKGNLLGVTYSANVADLAQPLIVNLVALVAVGFGLLAIHLRPSLEKISDIVALLVMGLAILLFAVAKGAGESFGIAYYLIILSTALFALSKFAPALMLKASDAVCSVLSKVFNALREQPKPIEPATPVEPAIEPVEPTE